MRDPEPIPALLERVAKTSADWRRLDRLAKRARMDAVAAMRDALDGRAYYSEVAEAAGVPRQRVSQLVGARMTRSEAAQLPRF